MAPIVKDRPLDVALAPAVTSSVPVYSRSLALLMIEFLGRPASFAFDALRKMGEVRELRAHEMAFCLDIVARRFLGLPQMFEQGYVPVTTEHRLQVATLLREHGLDEFATVAETCPGIWSSLIADGESMFMPGPNLAGSVIDLSTQGDRREPEIYRFSIDASQQEVA
jgi:hypothetical protein